MTLDVHILYLLNCEFTPPTVTLVSEVIEKLGADVKLQMIEVCDLEQAEALQFLGSPTVQINGQDIDPAMRNATNFGFF